MSRITVRQAVLTKVIEELGDVSAAAERLGIPAGAILRYLDGLAPVPDEILLRAVDIVLEDAPSIMRPSQTYHA